MWWRTRCPARRRRPPRSNGSAQPSPTNHPLTSRTWLFARSSSTGTSSPFQPGAGHHHSDDLDLIGDSSTGTFRLLVPRDLRQQVFEHLHGAAHPGRRATRRLISPGMYGKVSPQMSQPGRKPALAASGPKSTATYRYLLNTSQYPPSVSAISMWTWWGPSRPPRGSPTCSLSLTGHPAGLRQFLSPPPQQ